MYPVLILRSELICLVILIFLYYTSREYKVYNESKSFTRLEVFAFIHVVFDIITVITVNNMDSVPYWFNWGAHLFFYISAILYSNELSCYVIALVYPSHAKKIYRVGLLITAIFACCMPFIRMDFVEDNGTYSSAGPSAVIGYSIAFLFFFSGLAVIFTHMKAMSDPVKNALIPMMLVLMITEVCQVFWRSLLFTGGAVTIVTVGFFFSLENPVEVFKKKAMTDALTGMHSRSSFEEDIAKLDESFKQNPNNNYVFVFCDINDLRIVNNQFGHDEGDRYITLIATAITRYMKHCKMIYRIGGDEFVILYENTNEDIVIEEIRKLQDSCSEASNNLHYKMAVACGYACSSESYQSLRDVVKTADYAMYQNKSEIKNKNAIGTTGIKLNYTGLTDKIFDALCAANDRSYPFITNLDTNVTRIAPGWKEYFGLEEEFYYDFLGVWRDRIHPDFYQGYMDDVVSVINEHTKYHNYDYLAKKKNGDYVQVSCHGSVYVDSSTGTNYFTGFMVNYGMEENVDPVTGLQNFDILTTDICTLMDEGEHFSVLKLKLNNIARVNMLYGYNGGNEVIRKIATVLVDSLDRKGKVYCQAAVNFSILLETDDETFVENYYQRISSVCEHGIETETNIVPINISGGAVINHGERCEIEKIRGELVYAVEESQYNSRNNLVLYRGLGEIASNSDITLLSRIHADALCEMAHFRLRYQPIVDSQTGKTTGAEALIRWIHPEVGEVPPIKFIDFLENDPCYYRLGLHILDTAVRDAKRIAKVIPGFRINVNITALQLQKEEFLSNVVEILNKYKFSPSDLVLELTERCKEMDGKFLAQKIEALRKEGILVAFDDLGTGYSTINLLMDIPVDEIKLDKDFVADLGNRGSYKIFVESLVAGSRAQNDSYTICFEGIETEETLNLVKTYGKYLAQGYYFSKPLLLEEFTNYIKK